MPKSTKKVDKPEQAAGKTISTQLSDLRSENRVLNKKIMSQQTQLNEMSDMIKTMWDRIGL